MSAKLKWKDARGVREGVEGTERFFLSMMRMAHKKVLEYRELDRRGLTWAYDECRRHRSERKAWMFAIRALRGYTRANAQDVIGNRMLARACRSADELRAQAKAA